MIRHIKVRQVIKKSIIVLKMLSLSIVCIYLPNTLFWYLSLSFAKNIHKFGAIYTGGIFVTLFISSFYFWRKNKHVLPLGFLTIGTYYIFVVILPIMIKIRNCSISTDIQDLLRNGAVIFVMFLGMSITTFPLSKNDLQSVKFIYTGESPNLALKPSELFKDFRTFDLMDTNFFYFVILMHKHNVYERYSTAQQDYAFFELLDLKQLDFIKQKVLRARRYSNIGLVVPAMYELVTRIDKTFDILFGENTTKHIIQSIILVQKSSFIIGASITLVVFLILYFIYLRHLNFVLHHINFAIENYNK